jgi:hypothetical protein
MAGGRDAAEQRLVVNVRLLRLQGHDCDTSGWPAFLRCGLRERNPARQRGGNQDVSWDINMTKKPCSSAFSAENAKFNTAINPAIDAARLCITIFARNPLRADQRPDAGWQGREIKSGHHDATGSIAVAEFALRSMASAATVKLCSIG